MKKILILILLFLSFSCSTNNDIRGISLKAPLSENVNRFLTFTTNVLAPDGINTIIFNIGWNYEFKSFPELTGPDALSESDIKKIVKHCKSLGIEIIPKVSMLGHQSTLIRDNKGIAVKTKMHPLLENFPEFDENPEVKLPEIYEWPNKDGLYTKSYCPLHPKVHEVILPILDEIVDVFEAKTLHAGMDEVFYIGNDNCIRCSGKSKSELYANEVNLIYSFLKKRNVELMIWGDRMIDGKETGLGMWEASENDTYGSIDLINKDVIIADWHYRRATKTHDYFIEKGFRLLTCPHNNKEVAKTQYDQYINHKSKNYLGMVQTIWLTNQEFIDFYHGKIKIESGKKGSLETYKELVSLWKK